MNKINDKKYNNLHIALYSLDKIIYICFLTDIH